MEAWAEGDPPSPSRWVPHREPWILQKLPMLHRAHPSNAECSGELALVPMEHHHPPAPDFKTLSIPCWALTEIPAGPDTWACRVIPAPSSSEDTADLPYLNFPAPVLPPKVTLAPRLDPLPVDSFGFLDMLHPGVHEHCCQQCPHRASVHDQATKNYIGFTFATLLRHDRYNLHRKLVFGHSVPALLLLPATPLHLPKKEKETWFLHSTLTKNLCVTLIFCFLMPSGTWREHL